MELSSDIWVYALIRRAQIGGAFSTVVRRGDARGGAILVKTLDRRSGEARLWSQATGRDGESVWMQPVPAGPEADIDAYILRAAGRDPDLWVVEVEDADGRRFLTEAVDEG